MFLACLETNPIRVTLREAHYAQADAGMARMVARMENARSKSTGRYLYALRDGAADIAARVSRRSRILGRISMLSEAELPMCEIADAMRKSVSSVFGEVVTTTSWADDMPDSEVGRIMEELR